MLSCSLWWCDMNFMIAWNMFKKNHETIHGCFFRIYGWLSSGFNSSIGFVNSIGSN